MSSITPVELLEAGFNWQEVTDDQDAFTSFIGYAVKYNFSRDTEFLTVSEETKRKVDMLRGPHYKTIIKAYLTKEGKHLQWKDGREYYGEIK